MASIQERLSRSNCPGDIKAHCRCIDSDCGGDTCIDDEGIWHHVTNTTLNEYIVIADSTKAKAAIAAATSLERSIRTTLDYIERNKVPDAHYFASYSIDQYRHYIYTVTSSMEGAHWGHVKIDF